MHGLPTTQVTWSATGGTITTSGLYTAGDSPGTYTVTATSVTNASEHATGRITVQEPVTISALVGRWEGSATITVPLGIGSSTEELWQAQFIQPQDNGLATVYLVRPLDRWPFLLWDTLVGTYSGNSFSGHAIAYRDTFRPTGAGIEIPDSGATFSATATDRSSLVGTYKRPAGLVGGSPAFMTIIFDMHRQS
jgi:hypothetical protein